MTDPAEIEALAERLEDQCEYVASREGSQLRVPVPICDEAATALREMLARIAAKDAEIAALREALEQVIQETKYVENSYAKGAYRIARAALQVQP